MFDLLFVVAALLNGAGYAWELFRPVTGYDEVTHAFTSFALTLWLGFLTYDSVRPAFRGHSALFALVIATFGLALGVGWEMLEWIFIRLKDPILDLLMDAIGAALAGLCAARILIRDPLVRKTA